MTPRWHFRDQGIQACHVVTQKGTDLCDFIWPLHFWFLQAQLPGYEGSHMNPKVINKNLILSTDGINMLCLLAVVKSLQENPQAHIRLATLLNVTQRALLFSPYKHSIKISSTSQEEDHARQDTFLDLGQVLWYTSCFFEIVENLTNAMTLSCHPMSGHN